MSLLRFRQRGQGLSQYPLTNDYGQVSYILQGYSSRDHINNALGFDPLKLRL